ncbi:vWA domain-containing protein [Halobacteriovorax marinus]|uniref:hypothetical protein n=1 Tax=Halobacteriovorax marinus TaxID=97084 RepID=UPI001C12A241|nr:hypothetical protein [Halobacteriovorax marinus]
MVLKTSRIRDTFLLLTLLINLTSCNEQEFYEKKFLNGAGVADNDLPTEIEIPVPNPSEPEVPVVTEPTEPTTPTDPTDPVVTEPTDPTNPTDPTDPVVTEPTDPTNPTDPTDPVVTEPTDPTEPTEPTEPGITLKNVVEKFTQTEAKEGKVDILWVVDDSGSMGDEQKALAYNFDVFIHEFLEKKIDFKMAITTTDGTSRKDGRSVCDFRILDSNAATSNESKFVKDFASCIKVGTRGSGREQGLKTSKSFVNRYLENWMRSEAYLVVVYVSDEEDQSSSTAQSYVDFFKELKKSSGLIKLYSIVNTKKTGNSWETIGHRYLEVSDKTGGVTSHIKNDFYQVLREMGGKIVNLIDSFALSNKPYEDKVEVSVNGSKVSSGYTYDNQSRSIKFEQDKVPNEGSNIEISYAVETQEFN